MSTASEVTYIIIIIIKGIYCVEWGVKLYSNQTKLSRAESLSRFIILRMLQLL